MFSFGIKKKQYAGKMSFSKGSGGCEQNKEQLQKVTDFVCPLFTHNALVSSWFLGLGASLECCR